MLFSHLLAVVFGKRFFPIFLSWNCYRHHNRFTSSCKKEHRELWGAFPHGHICSQRHNQDVGFQIPPISVCSRCVCACVQLYHPWRLVCPLPLSRYRAASEPQGSWCWPLILRSISLLCSGPLATPQTCASSRKLTWQENYVESYTVCCVTFQDQRFST